MPKYGEIKIISLTESHFAEWSGLWKDYLAFYETSVDQDVYQSTFQRMLSGDKNEFQCFLALDGAQKPVGLVHFLFHRHAWKIENVCYLQDLFVAKEARGQGVARRLIEAVYAEADERGASTVYWMTQHFNETARVLYDKIAKLTPFIRYQRG